MYPTYQSTAGPPYIELCSDGDGVVLALGLIRRPSGRRAIKLPRSYVPVRRSPNGQFNDCLLEIVEGHVKATH